MTTKNKVRFAFVGLGWWSNMLADAAKKSDRIEIAACLSRSKNKMADFTKHYGGRICESYEDLVSSKDIDAIILTTPNSLHMEQAVKALLHGKNVYVEKPMALNTEECLKMIDASKASGSILMVGHNARRLARYRKAKELIEDGAVGDIILAEASSSGELGMRLTPQTWRWYRNESPGGPLTSFSIHQADNLNYLVGKVTKVSAFINKLVGPSEADDVVSSILQFENGALGYLGGSFITPDRNIFQINGTEGVVFIDEEGGSTSYQKKGTEKMIKFDLPDSNIQRTDSLFEEMDEFARCIQTNTLPEVTGEVGARAVAMLDAIIESSQKGGAPVEVENIGSLDK